MTRWSGWLVIWVLDQFLVELLDWETRCWKVMTRLHVIDPAGQHQLWPPPSPPSTPPPHPPSHPPPSWPTTIKGTNTSSCFCWIENWLILQQLRVYLIAMCSIVILFFLKLEEAAVQCGWCIKAGRTRLNPHRSGLACQYLRSDTPPIRAGQIEPI